MISKEYENEEDINVKELKNNFISGIRYNRKINLAVHGYFKD